MTTVADCVDSVARQTYRPVEHVVIDGASRDGTFELLDKRRDQFAVLLSEPDRGIYDALNKGLRLATGDVVGFLHADDIYASPEVLAHVAAAFEAAPDIAAVYGDLNYVRRDNPAEVVRRWRSSAFEPHQLDWGWMPAHPSLYVRREWYERIGGFDDSYRISGDYDSVLKMFGQRDFRTTYLPEIMVLMRIGGKSNHSLENLLRKTQEDWRALRIAGRGVVGSAKALAWKNVSKLAQFR